MRERDFRNEDQHSNIPYIITVFNNFQHNDLTSTIVLTTFSIHTFILTTNEALKIISNVYIFTILFHVKVNIKRKAVKMSD